MKVKRQILTNLFTVLENLKNKKMPIRMTYAIVKNRKIIQTEIDIINEVIKPSEKYMEYEKARISLCEKYCNKDDNNKPIISNNSYSFTTDNLKLFQNDFSQLQIEYKEEIEKRKNIDTELDRLYNEEIDVTWQTIKMEEIPEDLLTLSEFEILMDSGIIIE